MQNKKLFLAAAAACLTSGLATAQDECASAAAVGVGVTAFDTTTGTPSAEPWTCAGATHTGGDLWYTYTAVGSTSITFSLCGSGYDTALTIYDGTCGALNELQCNDDSCGLQSEVTVVPVAGTDYIIRVGGFSGGEGAGVLSVDEDGVAFNDDCNGAIPVATGVTMFDTTGAAAGAASPCVFGDQNDLWYSYTAAGAGGLTISLCGSGYDTALEVFTGDCGSLTSVACNDDTCGLQSEVAFTQIPGTEYLIKIGGFNGATGAGMMTVTDVTGVLNDECTGAMPLGEGLSGPFDTTMASNSSAWPCAGTSGPDIWFTYTPQTDGDFTISTCAAGTDYDTAIELFSGDCGSLTSLECNDDTTGCTASTQLVSAITYCGAAGTTYTFRLGGFSTNTGMAEIEITGAPEPTNCATTIFASNNSGSVGGAVFFDATFAQDVVITRLATNTSGAVGTAINADVYTTPGTSVGAEQDISLWTLVGSVGGSSAGFNNPSWMSGAPITIGAGTVGMAIIAVDYGHQYTNGNGTNQSAASADGVITLSLGQGQNVPFSSGVFSPRVWNGSLCHDVNIGTDYCAGTNNSTGAPGVLIASGSDCVSIDSLTLIGTNLPANAFGFFLTSQTQDMVAAGQGFICLGSPIGRGVGGAILNSGAGGVMAVTTNLMLPQPSGAVQVMAGETWNFQLWTRDSVGGMATSNTTNATAVTFR